jgi:hypothetical protein
MIDNQDSSTMGLYPEKHVHEQHQENGQLYNYTQQQNTLTMLLLLLLLLFCPAGSPTPLLLSAAPQTRHE